MTATPTTHEAYLFVEAGRIWIQTDKRHLDRTRSIPGAKWNAPRLLWSVEASSTSAGNLARAFDGLNVECDADFFALYQASLTQVEAAEMKTREDLPDHPSKTSSWLHQRQLYEMAYRLQGAGIWSDMGTGKTKVAVDLIANRGHRLVLVVCPKKVVGVWPNQIAQHASRDDIEVIQLGGKSDKRTVAERAQVILDRRGDSADHPLVFVTNYESFNSAQAQAFTDAVLSTRWDLVIADEAHRLKSPKSILCKTFSKFPSYVPYRIGMSGTPMGKGPLDVWGVYSFVDPDIFGRSYFKFRQRYAVMDLRFPGKVLSYYNLDEHAERMYSIAYRVTKEVLDLPEQHHIRWSVDLSAKAKRAHDSMLGDLISSVPEGKAVANNVLTKLLRMQQITSGFLPVVDENGQEQQVAVDDAKIEALEAILEDISYLPNPDPTQEPQPEPVVVFCRFTEDVDRVRDLAERMGRRYGEVSGRRNDLTEQSTMPANIDVMAIQIQAGGVGVDLTRARYAVYYSKGYNWIDYEQSLSRLHRPGQTRPVTYYHLVARGTVDALLERALQEKENLVETVWSLAREGQQEEEE